MNQPYVFITHVIYPTAYDSFNRMLKWLHIEPNTQVQSIVIKINLCDYRRPESGATTDPVMLGALLDNLKQFFPNAKLAVIENDATTVEIWSLYRLLGIDRVVYEHGAELYNVAENDWIVKEVPGGIVFKELEIPSILENCDLFINFTKLKTNALTKMTGCLKNIFGLLRKKNKMMFHNRINSVLVDMNKVIKPGLCLVDGYIGMESIGGPAFGKPKRCELLIGGFNPVAVDACCARIMGFRPLSIEHIRLCHRVGLGPIDYRLETDIKNFDYRKYKFEFQYWEYRLRNLLRSRTGVAT